MNEYDVNLLLTVSKHYRIQAEDVAECFDYEIEPFDPLALFYWKKLYGVENRFSRDNPFHKEKPFGIRATFIDCRYTHEEEHKDSACEAGTGYELWMDDKYNFFTVHFTELVERDKDGKILMSMRCRELSDEPFYTKTYPFLSEDFLETIEEKIEDAFDNDD